MAFRKWMLLLVSGSAALACVFWLVGLYDKVFVYELQRGLVFKTVGEESLKGDLYRLREDRAQGGGKRPAVLVVHGGSWQKRAGDMESVCEHLVKAGFVVFNTSYRFAPAHRYPSAVDDVRDALAWLRENADAFGVDQTQIFGWGYSAGAQLILMAGLDPKSQVRAIVAGGTPAALSAWPKSPIVHELLDSFYDENPKLWEEASPVNHVVADSPPVFLYHGEADDFVEPEQMEKMKEAMLRAGRPVQTYLVRYLGHIGVYLFGRDAIERGVAFLREQSPSR